MGLFSLFQSSLSLAENSRTRNFSQKLSGAHQSQLLKQAQVPILGISPFQHQFSSVAQLCLNLCDPMDCSTPGFPVHHQLPELTRTHVHWVGNAIQPSHPLSSLHLPLIFPSIRVFSIESALRIRWPKYWSFSFAISPSNKYSGLISLRIDWFDLLAVQRTLSRVFSNSTAWKHQFFGVQLSLWSNSHIHTWLLEKPYLWLDGPLLAKKKKVSAF